MSAVFEVVAKPVELQAVQFDGSLQSRQFLEGWVDLTDSTNQKVLVGSDKFYLPTSDGTVIGVIGDWVVRNLDGSYSLVRAKDFDSLYEIRPVALEGV